MFQVHARLRAQMPSECCKSAVKISSRSKLRRTRTASHVVRRNWARTRKFCEVYFREDSFIQCVMRRGKFAIFNLWALHKERASTTRPFVHTYVVVVAFFILPTTVPSFSSRTKEPSACSRKARACVPTLLRYVLNFSKLCASLREMLR